jgi:hypothetical protein
MSARKINIAIIGLGFGAKFIPIYQRHPNAQQAANWTCGGLCAHPAAPRGGRTVRLQAFAR